MTKKHPITPADAGTTIQVPVKPSELHQGLDMILANRTVSRAFAETLLQTLWIVRTGEKARQVNFARHLISCLDSWVRGGAA